MKGLFLNNILFHRETLSWIKKYQLILNKTKSIIRRQNEEAICK